MRHAYAYICGLGQYELYLNGNKVGDDVLKPGQLKLILQVEVEDVESAGDFSCSNEMFNRIHHMITYSMKSNTKSVFKDCHHREKLGWLEQTHLIGPGLLSGHASVSGLSGIKSGSIHFAARSDGAEQWPYEGLAGIKYPHNGKNSGKMRIKPYFQEDMDWLRASHRTIYGEIQISWKKKEMETELQVVILPNMTAEVMLPGQAD